MLSKSTIYALCAAACVATCAAQVYPTYNLVGSPQISGMYTGKTYAVDLNNDGIPDLIVDTLIENNTSPPVFSVFIANGDGTFKPPVQYNYPATFAGSGPLAMTFGDFNGDGNMDIAMVSGANAITVYLGKGDGTFVSPWHSWILSTPSNQTFNWTFPDIVAADFNHDGKVDLAVVGYGPSSNVVYILPGEGNGLFSSGVTALTVPGNGSANFWGVRQLLVGDFDGDGNADLAVMSSVGNATGSSGSLTPHILYGDGNFGFADTTPIALRDETEYGVADLNGDGKSDLYAISSGNLHTFYGQSNRTFASYAQPTIWGGAFSQTAVADFNDDGRNDLVTTTSNATSTFLVFYLATSTPGQFEYQTWNVPNAGTNGIKLPVVGDFNRDRKPDWAFVGTTTTGNTIAYTGLNETPGTLWSNCDYPHAQRGVNLCSPAVVSGSTVNFSATARSLEHLRKVELWVDGKKLAEQYHTWGGNGYFNSTASLAAGTHYGTYFGSDISNTLVQENFTFTVPSGCSAPSTAGVHICWPTNGASINATSVVVDATARVTGTLARVEVWVDSVKKYTEFNSPSVSAAVEVTPGTHKFTVFAVNTSGAVWSSTTTATIP